MLIWGMVTSELLEDIPKPFAASYLKLPAVSRTFEPLPFRLPFSGVLSMGPAYGICWLYKGHFWPTVSLGLLVGASASTIFCMNALGFEVGLWSVRCSGCFFN